MLALHVLPQLLAHVLLGLKRNKIIFFISFLILKLNNFIINTTLLGQTLVHCPKFPTAAIV